MDKQTNILANTQSFVPVNTRTIGAPEGIYILYLEDYVHTFIKKILSDTPRAASPGDRHKKAESLEYQQDYQIESAVQQKIALYGRSIEENGRYRIVISGAAVSEGGSENIQQLNNTYFPSCSYIGSASVSLNKDSGLRLELALRSTKVILDDFYIYYDQNEEMQNYLVEWNTTRESGKGRVILSPTEHDAHVRSSVKDAAHLSRITQAYNREEAKVSFMWNVMNVLCLGFVVCVMAYGIISINNYNKMQNMQASIDYCIAFIEKNTSFQLNTANMHTDTSQPASAMQSVPAEKELQQQNNPQDTMSNISAETQNMSAAGAESQQGTEQPADAAMQEAAQALAQAVVEQNLQPTQESIAEEAAAEQNPQPQEDVSTAAQEDTVQPTASMEAQSAVQEDTVQPATPQYYVVRRGDTLRTICYALYGDYSRVDEICRWNNIDDPDNILYGQKLLLP